MDELTAFLTSPITQRSTERIAAFVKAMMQRHELCAYFETLTTSQRHDVSACATYRLWALGLRMRVEDGLLWPADDRPLEWAFRKDR